MRAELEGREFDSNYSAYGVIRAVVQAVMKVPAL